MADTPLQLLDIAAHKGRTVLAMKNGAGTITLAMNATGTTLAQRWTEGFTEHLHVGKHGNAWAGTTADSKRRFIVRAGADLVPIWRYETALSATSIVVGALPKNEALAIVTRPPQEDCSVPGGRFGKCDADYLFRFQRIDAGGRVSWSKDISHRSRAGTGHVWRVASSPVSGAVAASVGSFYDGLSDEVSRTLVVQLSPLQTWKVWKSWLRVHRIAIAGSGTVIGGGNRTETPHEGLKLQTWEVRWFTREWPNPSAEPDFGYDESSVQHGCSTGYDALFVTRQDFQKNGLMSEPPLADLWLWRKNQAGETVWGRPLALPAAATPTPLVSESDLRVAQSAKEPVFLAWSASWNHPTKRAEGVVVTQLSPYGGPYCSVDKCSGGDVSDVCDSKGESCKVAWCDAATGCAWKWSEQICGGGYGYPMFCKVGGTCGS